VDTILRAKYFVAPFFKGGALFFKRKLISALLSEEIRNAYLLLAQKPEEKRPLKRRSVNSEMILNRVLNNVCYGVN
jgi:hypothetical protein